MEQSEKIKIIYILSYPRSGSTLLGNLLGRSTTTAFHTGEVERFWKRKEMKHMFIGKCGCGELFADCEFWGDVLNRTVRTNKGEQTFFEALRVMFQPHQASFNYHTDLYRTDDPEMKHVITELYRQIRDKAQCETIVDSSKDLSYLKFLMSVDDLDVKVIHLYRNPMGVVNSRIRKKRQRDTSLKGKIWQIAQWPKTALDWRLFNNSPLIDRIPDERKVSVNYEEFVAQFPASYNRLAERLQSFGFDDPGIAEGEVLSLKNHVVRGNNSKYNTSGVEVRMDSKWKRELPPIAQRIVSTVAGKQSFD